MQRLDLANTVGNEFAVSSARQSGERANTANDSPTKEKSVSHRTGSSFFLAMDEASDVEEEPAVMGARVHSIRDENSSGGSEGDEPSSEFKHQSWKSRSPRRPNGRPHSARGRRAEERSIELAAAS